jgi:hypothetical protein
METNTLPETIPMSWTKYQEAGECGCVICGRPMKDREKPRFVHIGEGGISILRADLPLGGLYEEAAMLTTPDGPKADTGDMGWFPIGPNCARKIGLAYTKEFIPGAGVLDNPVAAAARSEGH